MTAWPHRTRFRMPRAWVMLTASQAAVIAAALFAAIYVLQAHDANDADTIEVLYVLPIALLAARFGCRGGVAGALVGIGLIIIWDVTNQDFNLSAWGALSWAAAFVLLGALLGSFVDHSRMLEDEISRYFNESLDMLVTLDTRGRFTRVNPACERALGYSAETLCSRPFIEFVHPDDRKATIAEYETVASGSRDAVGFRNRYRTADGGYRCLEWSAHTAVLGGVVHALARDVTAQHEAELQLANHAELLEGEVAERTRELEDSRTKMLQRLALASEYRDDDTFQHTERVGATSAEIGARLGLDADQVRVLRLAAPLHDVGKIGVPDRILLKAGKLNADEYEAMKTHTKLGARLLGGSGSCVLQMATVIAESHHERWDGTGYPHGLAGEAIPLVGRIVAVADVFDALTHERPYKTAWPVGRALVEIRRESGSQFDPRVVEAFLEIHEDTVTRPRSNQRAAQPRRARSAGGVTAA